MSKALVIGLGMGQQYALWLKQLSFEVITVDPATDKNADYTSIQEAVNNHNKFDLVYIGTPNWTHGNLAREIASHTRLLIIEKPGLENSEEWKRLVQDYPATRIMMVRNNQYRTEMSGFALLAKLSRTVNICWSRKDGVPTAPWFTDKSKAFGGVSRDLMPHLLSMYTSLANFKTGTKLYAKAEDKNNTGIDDYCEIEFGNTKKWLLTASWKNNKADRFYIEFDLIDEVVRFDLGDYMTAFGGCPAGPYMQMITTAVENLNNDAYWQTQLEEDVWIHKQIENL